MDLTLLRTFLTVYRAGAFTRASLVLGLSQPAVTAHIRALEQQLGQRLFERLPRGVQPTATADELAAEVAPHLDALEDISDRGLPRDAPFRHVARIGASVELLALRVLPALAELMRAGLRLRAGVGRDDELVAGLTMRWHDLIVVSARPRLRGLSSVPLASEQDVLVGTPAWGVSCPPEKIAASGGAALAGCPLADVAEEAPFAARYWTAVFGDRLPTPPSVVAPDVRAVLAVVRGGAAVAVLPRYLCAAELARGELMVLHEPAMPPTRTLYAVVRAGGLTRPQVAAVHERLLADAARW
jgi:DNA-binding transcriptional LysR family regulator